MRRDSFVLCIGACLAAVVVVAMVHGDVLPAPRSLSPCVAQRKLQAVCTDLGAQAAAVTARAEIDPPDTWFALATQLVGIGTAHCGGDPEPALTAYARRDMAAMRAELRVLQRLWCPTCTPEAPRP